MGKDFVICPGCGATIETNNREIDEKYNAAKACLDIYWKLSAYTLSLQNEFFLHQYVVDAYAASHASVSSKPIRVTFALAGIYLALEYNFSGKEAQHAHMLLASKNKDWPLFLPPNEKPSITVVDILRCNDNEKEEMIKQWIISVWDIWKQDHEKVASLVHKYMQDL